MTRATSQVVVTGGVCGGLVLLLGFVALIGWTPTAAQTRRTIDVRLSRYAFSPAQVELRVGEPVRLNLTSVDGVHGFRVKALRINEHLAPGHTAVVDLTPTQAGTFEITCSEYCGSGHGRMKASLVVRPGD